MEKNKQIPNVIKIGAWLLSFIVFVVGFWHTHLGLKEMRPFGSEYGSLAIAGIVLLLLLITYYFAVSGNKIALLFYVFCGLFFFTFNMNYFYPSYLGRQLVKEEATALNDTLQHFSNKGNGLLNEMGGFKNEDGSLKDYLRLQSLQKLIVDEVKSLNGVGPRATAYLNEFNKILKDHKANGIQITYNNSDEKAASFYDSHLGAAINDFLVNNTSKGSKLGDAANFVTGIALLDSLQQEYTPILKENIIPDNSDVEIENVKTNKQIKTLQNLVSGLDEATSKINEAAKKDIFTKLEEAKTRNLGRVAHTFSSVKERISKVDTWTIIFICLFIDLLVPLAIYILLKKKDGEETKVKPITKPGYF